jgi:hypothetical protein
MNESMDDADDDWFDLFTPEEGAAIAELSAIRYEMAAFEQAFFDDLDRRMREAGFIRLAGEALSWPGLADEDRNGLCYSRDGLVACYTGSGWRVLARATGELLTELPEEADLVARFVMKAEPILCRTSWPPRGPLLGARLRQIAGECVEDELRICQAVQARLETWLNKRKGMEVLHPLPSNGPQQGIASAKAETPVCGAPRVLPGRETYAGGGSARPA